MSKTKDPQGRRWMLTLNAPQDKGLDHKIIKERLSEFRSLKYLCMADEKGRTAHTHVFFALEHATRFSTVKRRFPTAHVDRAEGTAEEIKAYIQKSGKWADSEKGETSIPGTFEEWGELPTARQGERTDLAMLYEYIKDGLSNYEIIERNPDYMLNLEKIERVRQVVREQQYRELFRKVEVIYIFGRTGLGKTRSVMEEAGYTSVYRVTDYAHAFDNYAGEDVLLLEEYSSNFRIQDLLTYLDGYPLSLPCRYANRVACYTKVYIVSNICLSKQYREIQINHPETFEALLRLIQKVRQYVGPGEFIEYDTTDYMDELVMKQHGWK